jgi:hypothetical protein
MTDVEKNKTPTHTSETMSDAVAMTSTASAEGMKQEEEKQFQQSARQEEALEHDIAATKKNKETEQDVEKTKAALEKTQQAAYNKQLDVVKKQHIPRIHDLDDGTPLEATIEKKAGNAASAEMLYNKIDATYKDLLEPFFVGIDGFGAREMQVVVTGLSLHLFQRFSGKQGRDREALFAQADAFKNIKEDEHFLTGIFDRGKDIAKLGGISTLLEMSGLLQFFAAFKEEDMRTALAARK